MNEPARHRTSQAELDEIACEALPRQGNWTDEEYLWLTDRCRRLIEFTDGYVEDLPMPTSSHQAILAFLYRLFFGYLEPRGGIAMFAALRLRIREGKFREPDLLVLRDRNDERYQDRYWLGADLVAEVVNPDRPARDLVEKRVDYAEAGIPEYWIVDPRDETVAILTLAADAFVEHGVFTRGDIGTSASFDDLSLDVDALFDAAQNPKRGVRTLPAASALPSRRLATTPRSPATTRRRVGTRRL